MSGGGYRVVASTPADEPEDAALLSKTQHEEGAGGTTLAEPAGKWRWVTALMACMMWLCTYADRTNISLAIVEMESEFGWSAASDGVVLSSFFVGMPDEVQSLYTIADNVYGNPATEKQVRKRSLLLSLPFLLLKSFLYVKHDHLPRQARNKHEG